ncbi:MAG: type II toxin-antitoxin system VapC family toxin [Anaerolineae bacterium]|uniref:type II toxin-antitoxin system VapC family toxin n=1 Tax=Promineifilum sp. TaxID=2664178 RepID=UPI001D4EB698|nr:type II toxin-antitoxin system VapC family toxin [Anaerolineales bacterium]MCB8934496.1 type II toxin-antitoxin system VapC family toxin [Promineifilum sp.]MCO5179934.1 type II toxin-antitoxin system VapC family toxin [Promineifilum sp.]MCW5847094.1 type II toxin-antitoxin system VapC family toxin [Anaerolineae bacterium]
MILDSSAIVTIFLKAPGHDLVRHKIVEAQVIGVGAATLVETAIVLSARLNRDMRGSLARFIEENQIITIPFTEGHYSIAVTAWLKYGKGRHPAALNFGDCLSYATARAAEIPLLCVGDDFPQTDLALA